MTAFNASTDLPADINTVEQLTVWCLNVLNYLYKDETVQESTSRISRVCDAAPFEISFQTPIVWRYIARVTIPLNRDWQLGNNQIWNNAQTLGSASIPAAFKS